jgi:hypothetical protein
MPIIGYIVNYTRVSESQLTSWTDVRVMGDKTSLRVTGLEEFSKYGFRVIALNAAYFCVGNGEPSPMAFIETTISLLTPISSAPRKDGSTEAKGGSIDVVWDRPTGSNLARLSGYTLFRARSPSDNYEDVMMRVTQLRANSGTESGAPGVRVRGAWSGGVWEVADATDPSKNKNEGLFSSSGDDHGSSIVEFRPDVPASGMYSVQIIWPGTPSTSRSAKVPVLMEHGEGSFSSFIDQSSLFGVWADVGTFFLEAGIQSRLTIGTTGIDKDSVAAISRARFVLLTLATDNSAETGFTPIIKRNLGTQQGLTCVDESSGKRVDPLWDSALSTCFRLFPHSHAGLDGQLEDKWYLSARSSMWHDGTSSQLLLDSDKALWVRVVDTFVGTSSRRSGYRNLESCAHPGLFVYVAADKPYWVKRFDGQCTDGSEVRMYDGDGDNEGSEDDMVARCAKACLEKRVPKMVLGMALMRRDSF